MNVIGKKRNGSSSKVIFEKDGKAAEGQLGDDMEMVEVPVTDSANPVSVTNGTNAKFCVFNVSNDH